MPLSKILEVTLIYLSTDPITYDNKILNGIEVISSSIYTIVIFYLIYLFSTLYNYFYRMSIKVKQNTGMQKSA